MNMKVRFPQILCLVTSLVAPGAWAAAPTILCSSSATLECTNPVAVVEATVQDTDGDNLMVVWAINGIAALTNVIDSASASNGVTLSLTNEFAFGTNDVSVGVTDDGTNVVMCSTTVAVVDTTPPVIESIVASPNLIWPPNHKLKRIRLVVNATDSCGDATWRIAEVTSNEADDEQGSGNTAPDWVIEGDQKVWVRAERSGRGHGRSYTIKIEATDASGNSTFGDVRLCVPHDKGHHNWDQCGEDTDDDSQGDDAPPAKGKGKGKAKGKEKAKKGKKK
jgi:hypothetical protein